MDRRMFAASVLAMAVGVASTAAVTTRPASAQALTPEQLKQVQEQIQQATANRASKDNLEHCYGIAQVGFNDCAGGGTGPHGCAGHGSVARNPADFVLLPKGDCVKIAGASLTPGS